MCGIFGYIGFEQDERLLRRMADVVSTRGPDDEGFLMGERVGLGMRRLSIIDVNYGHQPIFNKDKTLAIFFNGEIYNYKDLTKDLQQKGYKFRTHSDTEVILHLFEEYGPQCVNHLNGMFAFVIYNIPQKTLFIARDRIGIKPLYYWAENGEFLFGSEIKSILEYEKVSREPNLAAIDHYLTLRYVPGPSTMFVDIHKFPAGHWGIWKEGNLELHRYWSPQLYSGPYHSDEYYHERFAELFKESVRKRMMSEVPLGAFLSGGIDSSAIVAAMSQLTNDPVKTFSVGFDWPGDELPAAREVARKLGCDHHEIKCRPEDFSLFPDIIQSLDEPIGDAIVVPLYLLSKLAHQHVKVVLTGDGGDEALAGYIFHKVMYWARQYSRWTPDIIQDRMVKPLVLRSPFWLINLAFSYPEGLAKRGRLRLFDYLSLVQENRPEAEYRSLLTLFDTRDKERLYRDGMNPFINGPTDREGDLRNNRPYLDVLLKLQYSGWLPDCILNKLDKTSMAHSVEARVPFLDHDLVEFLYKSPSHLKLNGLRDKVLLRDQLAQLLPGHFSRRKKINFYIPIGNFLHKEPLRGFVETCLSEESVRKRGYFSWEMVKTLRNSIGKEFIFDKQVLALVALEIWHRIFIDRESGWASSGSVKQKKDLGNSVVLV
ncbi:MAG: asparagine synthase (glutamine-hydrolyzing) [Nitrospina sp.]|jgi:asparagine synthase (glutamine-hydrolysing)|nr:asparagine synthase (glutamine-hydrolyzing) [Nitrospina sp.]MBT4048843.1 asparagine synthase (glutamine-hydrolyzing) [Nitrospina sp.]MBT4390861.1 asparagine synthase (glutamine-hydrolyzing) [Nitrospina sp.]MBT4556912.1 asparagine synthase (glutamine-hydrolyzing) [Nitrospina sp.]MBT6741168.1 asparagine synthase (glutamine-hydrolyzing) [Nitrospina sp.]